MTWFVVFLCFVFIAWAGFVYLRYKSTDELAKSSFNAALKRKEFPADEPFSPYRRAFLKTSDLRVNIYRLVASLTAVIFSPIVIIIVSFIWMHLYYALDRPAAMTEGELVHSFALVVFWMINLAVIAAYFARRYHTRRPGDFETEWQLEKQSEAQGIAASA